MRQGVSGFCQDGPMWSIRPMGPIGLMGRMGLGAADGAQSAGGRSHVIAQASFRSASVSPASGRCSAGVSPASGCCSAGISPASGRCSAGVSPASGCCRTVALGGRKMQARRLRYRLSRSPRLAIDPLRFLRLFHKLPAASPPPAWHSATDTAAACARYGSEFAKNTYPPADKAGL